MNRNRKVVAFVLVSLICLHPVGALAQVKEKTTAKGSVHAISFGGNLPKPKPDSAHDTVEILKGDMLSAKKHDDQGITYGEKGKYDLALAEFNKALDIYPSAETYNNRGITYSKKGDLDHAIADFTRALEIDPYAAKAYYNRGLTYAIKGQVNSALSDLKKCLELDPTNAAAYDIRGSVLVALVCSDWANACKLGNCEHIREAVEKGLCVAATGTNPLLP